MVGKSSYSLQAGLSRRHWMHCGEILLLADTRQTTMRDVQPGASKRISPLCSLDFTESNVGRFSYSSEAGHLLSSFGAWWRVRISTPCTERQREGSDCGEKENLPTMLCRRHSEDGGEILLLIPGWTLWLSLDAWWGDSLTCHYVPNDDGMSSLGQVGESPHHAPNDDERVQTGESKRISPPCSLVIQSMVGRFSYSPQAGLSHHHSVHGQEILLLATMRQTTTRYVLPKACKKSPHHTLNDDNRAWWANSLTHPRLDSLVIVGCLVGRFSHSPQRAKR